MLARDESNTIIIIGGGPIVLANACGIKKLNPKTEEMQGMYQLSRIGLAILQDDISSADKKYALFAVANDLHCKFNKAYSASKLQILTMREMKEYTKLRKNLNKRYLP